MSKEVADDFDLFDYHTATEVDTSYSNRSEEKRNDESTSSKDNFDFFKYLADNNTLNIYMSAEESKELDGSLTNNIVETGVGTVLKEFSSRPKMSYVQAAGRIPSLTLERQDQQDRINNERQFREFISKHFDSDYFIEVPDILGVEDNFVEFEALNGDRSQ